MTSQGGWRRSWAVAIAILLTPAWLAGCVLEGPAKESRAAVLFSVVLKEDVPTDRQPAGLIVSVDEGTASAQQFAFAPSTHLPGQYTSFLVRLSLPPGQHHLSGLSGVSGSGAVVPALDLSMNVRMDLRPRTVNYIGHFEFSNRLMLADSYDGDLPAFVHAWPQLKARAVAQLAPPGSVAIATLLRGSSGERTPHDSRESVARLNASVTRLAADVASGLQEEARAPFLEFLQSGYPRAFAISSAGDTGMAAGGKGVIERALSNCRRVLPPSEKAGCHLFALDDTLVPAS